MTESIDLSNNNGADFPLARVLSARADLSVVGIKATEGTYFDDPDFMRFFATAAQYHRAALPYCFARPENDRGVAGGVREADKLIASYGTRSLGRSAGVPVCDYETVRDVAFARGFLSRVAARYKRRPLVYCSASRVAELRADSWIAKHADFWVADYGVSALPALGVHVVMWQYTDAHVSVAGIPPTDASHVLVPADELLLHRPPRPRLLVLHSGRVVLSIRYGAGRVRRFLGSSRALRLLGRGDTIKRRA
jgi:GH25 family lysozyme M1 (1,4-beta-N-acetylmuramidase)